MYLNDNALTFDRWIGMVVTVRHLAPSSLLKAGTVPAPILRLHLDGPRPGHGPGTAVGIASRPRTPRRHLAVHHCKKKEKNVTTPERTKKSEDGSFTIIKLVPVYDLSVSCWVLSLWNGNMPCPRK